MVYSTLTAGQPQTVNPNELVQLTTTEKISRTVNIMNRQVKSLFYKLTGIFDKGNKPPYDDGVVELAGQKIYIQLADDLGEQVNGLSGRESMRSNQGMLFVYDKPTTLSFWMKGMLIPIDIIWISGDTVVDMNQKAQEQGGVADRDLIHYSPSTPSDKVLELTSGWAEKNGLDIGDRVEFKLN